MVKIEMGRTKIEQNGNENMEEKELRLREGIRKEEVEEKQEGCKYKNRGEHNQERK